MWKRLDPKISTSEKHTKFGFSPMTLWVMMLPHSDSQGRYFANPTFIKGQCLPLFDHVRGEQIEAALMDLDKIGLIHLYEAEGKRYLVFHDVQDFNPPGALRYQKAQWPSPPDGICRCVAKKEAPPAIIPAPLKEPSGIASKLAAIWNDGPGVHLSGAKAVEQIQAALDIGVTAQDIDQAFWNHKAVKGRKIWEVLDPLRPKGQPAICSVDDVMQDWAKKGTA